MTMVPCLRWRRIASLDKSIVSSLYPNPKQRSNEDVLTETKIGRFGALPEIIIKDFLFGSVCSEETILCPCKGVILSTYWETFRTKNGLHCAELSDEELVVPSDVVIPTVFA